MAKVLLVEDDNNLREIYQARLMAEGYQIVAAQDGEEALVIAKKEHPDLIISDVMMPRISGFEMLDILRNTDELKHTKVIMLTALGQAEDQTRANNLGADKYLVKSQVTLEDIVKSAQELLTADGVITPADTSAPAAAGAAAPSPAADPAAPSEPATPAVASAPAPQAPTPAPVAPAAPAPPQPPTVNATDPALETEPPQPESVDMPVAEPPQPAPAPNTAETTAPTPTQPPAADTAALGATVIQPTDSTPVEATSEAAIKSSEPQSLREEEAAIEKQIENYAAAPAPAEAAPAAAATDQSEKVRNDDAVIAKAVEDLNTASTAPAAPTPESVDMPVAEPPQPAPAPNTAEMPAATPISPETPAPAAQTNQTDSTSDAVTVAGKKIIQPIGTPNSTPNLNELLAKETAEEQANSPAAPNQTTITPTVGDGTDPKSITI